MWLNVDSRLKYNDTEQGTQTSGESNQSVFMTKQKNVHDLPSADLVEHQQETAHVCGSQLLLVCFDKVMMTCKDISTIY